MKTEIAKDLHAHTTTDVKMRAVATFEPGWQRAFLKSTRRAMSGALGLDPVGGFLMPNEMSRYDREMQRLKRDSLRHGRA